MQLANIVDQELFRRQVVDGNIEKALDGVGMEVQRDHPVRARQGDDVGHQLRRDRIPRLGLFFLAGVAIVGNYGGDPAGRGAAQRAVYPSTIFISARPIARLPAGTSFVTTVSAAVVASLPSRTGATKIVSHET